MLAGAEERAGREQKRLRESMQDSAELAQALAAAGVFTQDQADEHRQLTEAVADKLAPQQAPAAGMLKAFVERIERLEEEKKAVSEDIRDVYSEAKGNGFDVKALRNVIRIRKQDANERAEQEMILETYLRALGML